MEEIYKELAEWQTITFPKSDMISKLYHLKEEVAELILELECEDWNYKRVESEYADCFLLLLGSADKMGYSIGDIVQFMKNKLEVNRKRKWGEEDSNGVVKHIKENS